MDEGKIEDFKRAEVEAATALTLTIIRKFK
jgi:hypothetical protein